MRSFFFSAGPLQRRVQRRDLGLSNFLAAASDFFCSRSALISSTDFSVWLAMRPTAGPKREINAKRHAYTTGTFQNCSGIGSERAPPSGYTFCRCSCPDPRAVRGLPRASATTSETICPRIASISDRSPVIHGEMVVLDETGRASFRSQRSVIMTRPALLVLVVFDLLHLNGSDLREQPAEEPRRASCPDPRAVRGLPRASATTSETICPRTRLLFQTAPGSSMARWSFWTKTGRASFRSQRSVIMTRPALLVLVVFDLLHLNGSDLREQPAEEPRRAPRDLVTPRQDVAIQFSQELRAGPRRLCGS